MAYMCHRCLVYLHCVPLLIRNYMSLVSCGQTAFTFFVMGKEKSGLATQDYLAPAALSYVHAIIDGYLHAINSQELVKHNFYFMGNCSKQKALL